MRNLQYHINGWVALESWRLELLLELSKTTWTRICSTYIFPSLYTPYMCFKIEMLFLLYFSRSERKKANCSVGSKKKVEPHTSFSRLKNTIQCLGLTRQDHIFITLYNFHADHTKHFEEDRWSRRPFSPCWRAVHASLLHNKYSYFAFNPLTRKMVYKRKITSFFFFLDRVWNKFEFQQENVFCYFTIFNFI